MAKEERLTDLSFLERGKAWPPEKAVKRLQRIEQNRKLFEGDHDEVYEYWTRITRELKAEQAEAVMLVLNWHKRLSVFWATLLLSEPPRITAGEADSDEQQFAHRLIKVCRLLTVAREVALDMSRFGVGLFKVRHSGLRAIIEAQPPDHWFPVVSKDNIKDVQYHVLAITYKEQAAGLLGNKEAERLKVEIHSRGLIEERVYELDGGRIGKLLEEKRTETGYSDFLVIPVHNLSTSDRSIGMDDYHDIDGIVQELEVRVAQIARILDKHADPSMHGPQSALELNIETGKWEMKVGGGKYFTTGPGDTPPDYITWDGQLEAAFKFIDALMEQLYFISETSPAAFGQLKAGLAESGSALRRLMMAPISKASRIRTDFDPAIEEVFKAASALEVKQGTAGAVLIEEVEVEWQDGLPRDDTEDTQNEVAAYGGGITSLESAIRKRTGMGGEALQKEVERIQKEKQIERPGTPVIKLPERGGHDDHNH